MGDGLTIALVGSSKSRTPDAMSALMVLIA